MDLLREMIHFRNIQQVVYLESKGNVTVYVHRTNEDLALEAQEMEKLNTKNCIVLLLSVRLFNDILNVLGGIVKSNNSSTSTC